MSGFSNQPKILRGAFVEFGINIPPLIVVFQFNPLTITRSRSAYIINPRTPLGTLRQPGNLVGDLLSGGAGKLVTFRQGQTVTVQPERLSFDIRLDATDKLDEGDTITEQFGITPQLSTLELMMMPKSQGVMTGAISALLGGAPKNFAFFDESRDPPVTLFIWGRKKILPVNITSMQIREEQFTADLNATRAVVNVSLEVIEGSNAPYLFSQTAREVMSLLNLNNIGDIANTMVPL